MLNINNTKIQKLTTTSLMSLQILKPEIQRIIDNTKVVDIVNLQLDFFKKHNYFNFSASGLLNIHHFKDQYWLLDGQHRLAAMEILYDNHGHNIEAYVLTVSVNTYEELKFNYDMINKNTPLPDFSLFENIDKKIPELVAVFFQQKYSKMWSKTSKARRPHIYFNYFQETLAYICDQLNIKDVQSLQDLITDYNTKLSSWEEDVFKETYKVNESQYNSAKDHGFFLGLFSYQPSEEYGFQWARKIVEEQTGKIIKSTSSYSKKKKIPKKVKNDAWDKYIGKDVASVKCLCCRNTEINAKDFVAGHIISEYNGGEVIVDNLVPICQQCNNSMLTTNMNDYVALHYPQNLDTFLKKDYMSDINNNKSDSMWAYFTGK